MGLLFAYPILTLLQRPFVIIIMIEAINFEADL